ncbi:MAG: hypothetical protein K0S70_106 [Microbacterium sp.]|nr:hypothetical protein [Microbacterium sp.]
MMGETILGIDPGGTTGWSLWELPDDLPAMRLQYGAIKGGAMGFLFWMERNLGPLRPSLIVFERFNPDLGYGDAKDYEALIIQGLVMGAASALGIDLLLHETGMKAMCTDDALKRLGFYITPAEAKVDPAIMHEDARDVNDSEIHVLAHAKAIEHQPTLDAFWPEIVL